MPHIIGLCLDNSRWLVQGTLLFIITLIIAIVKPYRKAHMNYWDIAILTHLATLLYVLSSGSLALLLARILYSIPVTAYSKFLD